MAHNDTDKHSPQLIERIGVRAAAFDWSVDMKRDFAGASDESDSLLRLLGGEPRDGKAPPPAAVSVRKIVVLRECIHLLIAEILPGASLATFYESSLLWAGKVVMNMTAIERADAQLFLVVPDPSDQLTTFQSQVEADERICRKFLWRTAVPSAAAADAFLDRTLLAQPWADTSSDPRPLDPFQLLASVPGVPADVVARWLRALGGHADRSRADWSELLIHLSDNT